MNIKSITLLLLNLNQSIALIYMLTVVHCKMATILSRPQCVKDKNFEEQKEQKWHGAAQILRHPAFVGVGYLTLLVNHK